MKNLFALFSAVFMAVSSVHAEADLPDPLHDGVNTVDIYNPTDEESWAENIKQSWHYRLFEYLVTSDCHLTIYAEGDKNTYGALFDKNEQFISASDADSDGSNFKFEFDAMVGDVYYIGVRLLDAMEVEDYTIHVDGPVAPCEAGHHTMGEYVEGTPVTCTVSGSSGYYMCSTCHHRYFDAEGTKEAIDLTIPAHHNIVDDVCTREGCGYTVSATILETGDNSVVIENPTKSGYWQSDDPDTRHYTLFKYTVTVDSRVTISSVGDKDTYGVLYGKDMNFIAFSDDNGEGSNFQFEFHAKAGDVCYIGACGYGGNEIGGYTMRVIEKRCEAVVGDVMYGTLVEALENINDGETVTLLADVDGDPEEEFNTNGTITLDLNGYTAYGYVWNCGDLTIEDSSEGKTGKLVAPLDGSALYNSAGSSITINGGTFVGYHVTYYRGTYYINGGTFMLADGVTDGWTMHVECHIIFGENVVYRDLSGEHEDISEITEDVTYSGTFVNVGTATAISPVQSPESLKTLKTLKTIENGRVVIIRGDKKYDLTGRKL